MVAATAPPAVASTLRGRLLSGISANALAQTHNVFAQLVTVPVFLTYWGAARYGVWLLLSAIPSYLVLADLGLGTAVGNELVLDVERDRLTRARELFGATLAFVAAISAAVLAAAGGATALAATAAARAWLPEWAIANAAAALALAVYSLASIYTSLLVSTWRTVHRYALGVNLGTALRAAETVVTIAIVVPGGSVTSLCGALMATRIAGAVLMSVAVRRGIPWLAEPRAFRLRFDALRAHRAMLLSGVSFMAFPLANALLNQGVLVAIGAALEPAAVAAFAVARSLTRLVSQALNVVIQAFQPEVTVAYARSDWPAIRAICRHALRWSFWLGAAACLAVAVLGPEFLVLWTRRMVALDNGLLWLLAAAQFVTTIWLASAIALVGTNRHRALSAYVLLLAVLTVAASGVAARTGGVRWVAGVLIVTEVAFAVFVLNRSANAIHDRPSALLAAPWRLSS